MKKTILFTVVCLFAFSCQVFAQRTQNEKKDDLWAYLSKMQTYSASFEQITADARGQVIQKSFGTMALKRPGYLKWETLTPVNQQLFVNKNIVWVYDVDLEQASKHTLRVNTNNPGMLLSSSVFQIKRQFVINAVSTNGNLTCFTLHQKNNASAEMTISGKVVLCFKNAILQKMILIQDFGDSTQFVFSNIRFNQPILISFFQFTPKPNVEILDQNNV